MGGYVGGLPVYPCWLICGKGGSGKWDGDLCLVGWQYRKINKTNRIMLNVIEISYRRYFSS